MAGVDVSVVIPAYNAAGTIGRTLESIAAQDLDGAWEVIVADDGSTDETVAIAERAGATVLRQDHEGPGPARNRGVAAASAPVIAFTDADCFPAPGWLREGLRCLESADLVQGMVRPDPSVRRQPFDRTVGVGDAGGLFECANMLLRRELFDKVGGFEDWLDARIGKPLAEDVWFGTRARRSGARIAYCQNSEVQHAVFRRGAGDYVAERLRLAYFPAIARRMPEFRDDFLHRRWFLSPRTAAFDLGLAGTAAGVVALVLGAGAPAALGLLAWLTYAAGLVRGNRRWGRRAPLVALADLAADAVGFVALVTGSLRWRSPVI
jgi:glycosyltransferase involved in cell wall biosynthesis